MAVTFNGIDRLIEVTNPADTTLDVEKEIYSAWKNWQQIGTNSKYAPAFGFAPTTTVFGGNPTIQGQFAPKYFFLTNFWRVEINNGQVVSIGTNLYSSDFDSPYLLTNGGVSDRNSDAVSINSADIEFASFNNGVTLDISNTSGNATSGTSFPTGTRRRPSNNLTDAHAIIQARGLNIFYVLGNLTLSNEASWEDHEFIGESPTKTIINVNTEANVTRAEFRKCFLQGTLDGNSEVSDSVIGNLSYVEGEIRSCILNPSTTMTLVPGAIANILSSYSGQPGSGTPTIDCGGTGQISLRDYNGGILITNSTGSQAHSLDINSGQIKLDPTTVTGGTFVCRGVGKLIDNSTGNRIPSGTWNGGVSIINELVDSKDIKDAKTYALL